MQPVYVVFAGVNGAGKSTFYRTGLWRTEDMPRTMTRAVSYTHLTLPTILLV